MNASLLNHLQGVKDYTFSGSVYPALCKGRLAEQAEYTK